VPTYGDPSTTQGPVWTPGSSVPRPAPAPVPFPRPSNGPAGSGLCGFDWTLIQYREFSSDDLTLGVAGDGINTGAPAVWTPKVRNNYFWVVLALGLSYIDSNTRTFAQFLMPPGFSDISFFAGIALRNNAFQFQGLGAGKVFDQIPTAGIRIQGSFGGLQTGMHTSLFTPGMLIVPSGWAILTCRDDTQAGSAGHTTVKVQIAYAELPIGSDAPGFAG
jgi:hypothetical protein